MYDRFFLSTFAYILVRCKLDIPGPVPYKVCQTEKQIDQARQKGYQKESRYGCDFITSTYRLLIANVFWPETANT